MSGGDATGYVFALSPLYAAGAPAFLLVMDWGLDASTDVLLPHVVVSLIVTTGYAAWFHHRSARARAEIRASL